MKVCGSSTPTRTSPSLPTSGRVARRRRYKDRVLHIEQRDEGPTWVVDGVELGFAKGGGVVDHGRRKIPFLDSMDKGIDWVHPGAWDP